MGAAAVPRAKGDSTPGGADAEKGSAANDAAREAASTAAAPKVANGAARKQASTAAAPKEAQERSSPAAADVKLDADSVTLDVGGRIFTAPRALLAAKPRSVLGRMFRKGGPKSVFLDRDGERFAMILDYLEHLNSQETQSQIRNLPPDQQTAMTAEFRFFELEEDVFRPWIYDGAFRKGPAMQKMRCWCAASAFGGEAVVLGGTVEAEVVKAGFEVTDSMELFENGKFVNGPKMVYPRSGCAAVHLDENRLMIVGGMDGVFSRVNSTEILHLKKGESKEGAGMIQPRCWLAAASLNEKWAIFVGGNDAKMTELYDVSANEFLPGPHLLTPRKCCAVIKLDDQRVLVAGGHAGLLPEPLDSTEVLDAMTMTFSRGPRLNVARNECCAVSVDERHILVIGGWDMEGTAMATTELLDVEKMTFTEGPSLLSGRYGCCAVRLEGPPRIVVFGGAGDDELGHTEVLAL
ncbi:hypothetical protein M885DRAFT_567885 [Pelagophyceae sp. CCMP2097]|nr:hypothetical protein M885DRAFT_567885 [Pelagophyceae sp. CCMP2097]